MKRVLKFPTRPLERFALWTTLLLLTATASLNAPKLFAQTSADASAAERTFPQSKAAVEKALKAMQANLAGHLPALEGFAQPADRGLENYQRAYYQATVQISSTAAGSMVQVSAKVTAWYNDPAGTHSGYQLLPSNGRLEADLLDQLEEQLARNSPAKPEPAAPVPTQASVTSAANAPTAQYPFPTASIPSLEAEARASARVTVSPPNIDKTDIDKSRSDRSAIDKSSSALRAEADSLEEAVKNIAHPANLVAIKKSGTPVVLTPSLTAKPQFMASLHDEFELLDFNQDWVHVRVSGLSRGWIWRNSVEMPNGIPDTQAVSALPQPAAADLFRVSREETAPFPGDWEPLRGKTVKILSVEPVDENAKDAGAKAPEAQAPGARALGEKVPGAKSRLEYAKFLLDQNYSEMTANPQGLAGIVLIFDSADGGMIAATLPALLQWRAGTLSDSALWHNCFFDPPEIFDTAAETAAGR